MMTTSQKKLYTYTGIIALVAIAAISGWMNTIHLPEETSGQLEVEIESGMSAGEVAGMLHEKGIIRSAFYFKLISRAHGYASKFKAGIHVIDDTMSVSDIAYLFTKNPPSTPDIRITVFEGLTVFETAAILGAEANIDSSEFVRLCLDKKVANDLGIDNDTLEGYIYPDTYLVHPVTEPYEMIDRMVTRFKSVFNDSLRQRAAEIGISVDDIVILASIIENEAMYDDERSLISSVFHRRLELGRPLEANPTIQYALGEKRRVLIEDLEIDSPYNTYTHRGLPPGPISSPGRASILAALYPADTKYLYFMADGEGRHVFSRTLNEHNRAVRQYRIKRRQTPRD